MSDYFQCDCRDDLQDAANIIHGALEHCESGVALMAVGAILRFLEEFDENAFSPCSAELAVFGNSDESGYAIIEFSIQVWGNSIRFGSGEHFSPGPSLSSEKLGYNHFWVERGEILDSFLLDEWVSWAGDVLEKVCRVEGVV